MRNVNEHSIYEFGEFVLDAGRLMLYRDDREITLPPKVVKTLSVLVENRGEILSKDDLMNRVWEDSIVEESNLSQYLYLLRKTVGNKPDGTPLIETLRRRGYRFTGDVSLRSDSEPMPKPTQRQSPHPTLIGREEEIEDLISLLGRPDTRLVTVSGVGGVGKTTLARAVAAKWSENEDTIFIELAPVTNPEQVVSAIASAFGLMESAGEPLADLVKSHLRKRSCLLVLDNFEQVAAAAPFLQELADSTGSSFKLLVTSRIPLRIGAESLYSLKPLSIPLSASVGFVELAKCESVALFAERAKLVQRDFQLTADNANVVAEICARLDGLPLAIELAAARTKLMSPEAVRNRLVQQLQILSGGPAEAPKRQQTMRETIAWSYDLLNPSEKSMFVRLGTFCGGFDLDAAEAVCADIGGPQGTTTLDRLSSLVEQNLLVVRTDKHGDPRIYMLEVLREFSLEALVNQGESERVAKAHAVHFLGLAESAEPQLVAARSAAWLDRLEKEHDNLRAALTWAKRHEPAIGQRIAGSIWRFWWLHGHVREACEQLGSFLEIEETEPQIRAKMLTGATFLTRLAGDPRRSRSYAEEGIQLAESSGDLRNGALAYNQLGFLALDVGDFFEAERNFLSGLKKAEDLGDIQILALLNNGLGELSRSKGEFDRAAEFYGRALKYNREAGDRVRQTTCLINLGATALMLEDREQAGTFYRQGLEISSEMEDMNGSLYCLEGMAGSYWSLRDPERAAMLFGAASAGRQENNLLLEPADKAPYDQSVALVRSLVGAETFEANFTTGVEMSLTEGTELALERATSRTEIVETSPLPSVQAEPLPPVGTTVVHRQDNALPPMDQAEPAPHSEQRSNGQAVVVDRRWKHVSKTMVAAAAGAILLLAGVSSYVWFNSNRTAAVADLSEVNSIKLTNGVEVLAASISPDGKYFAYHEPDGKLNHLWLQQTGQPTRHEIVPAMERVPLTITFTPDGQYIYFLTSDLTGEVGDLFRVATLGGPVTRILTGVKSGVSFSPDGREMVYYRKDGENAWHVIRASDGSGDDRILYPTTRDFGTSAWSPDGKWIAIARQANPEDYQGGCKLAVVKVENSSLIEFSDELWQACARMEWAPDSRGVYMIGTRKDEMMTTRRDQLFYVSFPGGRSRKITSGGYRHHWSSLGVTRDGSVLTVPFNRSSQIWAMDPNGEAATARQLTAGQGDGRSGIAPLRDGRVAYIARTAENLHVWSMNSDGSDQKQVTDNSQPIEELRSGGDGRYLVLSGYMSPPLPHLFRLNLDGTDLRQITSGSTQEIDSSMSHDGKWIVYDSVTFHHDRAEIALWKQPIEGGERVSLNRNDCQMPHFSPDDKYISCVRYQRDILILSADDGKLIRTIRVPAIVTINHSINFGARWTPDGKSVVYVVNEKGVGNLWTHPINAGPPKQLTNFTNGSIYHFAYSLDGTRLYLARGNQIRDAQLLQLKN